MLMKVNHSNYSRVYLMSFRCFYDEAQWVVGVYGHCCPPLKRKHVLSTPPHVFSFV